MLLSIRSSNVFKYTVYFTASKMLHNASGAIDLECTQFIVICFNKI